MTTTWAGIIFACSATRAPNQSLVSVAAVAAPPSTTIVVVSDQRGASPASSSPARKTGSVTKKSTIRTPAQMKLSVRSCGAAGVWKVCVSVGIERIAAASTVSVAIRRARG